MFNTIEQVRSHVEYLKTAWPYEINEHLATFQRLGAECKTIVEFGVGWGTSTWAFLSTQPQWVRSYDIIKYEQLGLLFETTKRMNWDWDLVLQNTADSTFEIPECDLLFIDSLHNAGHVAAELRHAHKVKKYIIFHDIEKWGAVCTLGARCPLRRLRAGAQGRPPASRQRSGRRPDRPVCR